MPSHDGRLRKSELTERPCGNCGKVFTPIRRAKGFYCSRPCANAGVARSTAERRGDALRGKTGQGKAYRKRNGRHEHRVVAEEMLGRPLRPGEIVHHKDCNKLNNSPSNLAVMTQAEHMREHGLAVPGQPRRRKT